MCKNKVKQQNGEGVDGQVNEFVMRQPTSEEMVEGVARALGKFLDGYYSAPYRSLSEDVVKGIAKKKLNA